MTQKKWMTPEYVGIALVLLLSASILGYFYFVKEKPVGYIVPNSCIDTDGGRKGYPFDGIYVKGEVSYESGGSSSGFKRSVKAIDACTDGNTRLYEAFCPNDAYIYDSAAYQLKVDCPYGCVEGACNTPPVPTTTTTSVATTTTTSKPSTTYVCMGIGCASTTSTTLDEETTTTTEPCSTCDGGEDNKPLIIVLLGAVMVIVGYSAAKGGKE